MQTHEHFMQRALDLAERGTGCTSPNPLVGCVVVHDGQVIGEGWHEQYGKAHAEVNALRNAIQNGAQTQGASLYVTLEPCNHHGLTPPCTHALMEAGISTVIYALADPNPRAAGGANWLKQQGIEIISGVLGAKASEQNRFFLKHMDTRLPYVIAKSAHSLDGRIATRSGHSQWITGPEAREKGHELRQAVDAIIVGADTVIADNPALTVRLPESICPHDAVRHPRPIILDSRGRVPLDAALLNGSLATRAIIITTDLMSESHRKTLESHGQEVIIVSANDRGVGTDPLAVLEALGQRGIHSVMIEGGATVHGTFRDANLIDEVWTFMAPMIIGGKTAPAAFSATGSNTLDEATHLGELALEHLGQDLLIRARVKPATSIPTRNDKTE